MYYRGKYTQAWKSIGSFTSVTFLETRCSVLLKRWTVRNNFFVVYKRYQVVSRFEYSARTKNYHSPVIYCRELPTCNKRNRKQQAQTIILNLKIGQIPVTLQYTRWRCGLICGCSKPPTFQQGICIQRQFNQGLDLRARLRMDSQAVTEVFYWFHLSSFLKSAISTKQVKVNKTNILN